MIGALAVAALLAAEALAVYVFGELLSVPLNESNREIVSAPVFVGFAFTAYFAPRVVDRFVANPGARLLTVAGLGVVVLYGVLRLKYAQDLALWDFRWMADFVVDTGSIQDELPPIVVSGLLLLAVWARSALRGLDEIWLEVVPRYLALPFALVTLSLVLASGSDQAAVVARGGVVFYGVALGALGYSQLAQSGASIGELRAGGVTTALLAGTAAFAVVGVLVVGVVLEVAIDVLREPVGLIFEGVFFFVMQVLLFPVIWVLATVLEWFFGLLGVGEGSEEGLELPAPLPQADGEGAVAEEEGDSLVARIGRYVLAGGALFIGLAVVLLVVIFLARLRRRMGRDDRPDAESEGLGGLGDDLRDAARNLFRRDRRGATTGEGVVRLYLDVLEQAERVGVSRAESQTASEFAPVLSDAFHREVTSDITAAFEHARYAGRPPDPAALDDLRRRWQASTS